MVPEKGHFFASDPHAPRTSPKEVGDAGIAASVVTRDRSSVDWVASDLGFEGRRRPPQGIRTRDLPQEGQRAAALLTGKWLGFRKLRRGFAPRSEQLADAQPHGEAMVTQPLKPSGKDKTSPTGFRHDGDLAFFDLVVLANFEKTTLRGKIGPAPLAVGLLIRTIGQSRGDNDRGLMAVEPEIEFGIHGVF